jgi:NADH-quinone oxidoreductase subunit L
MDALFAVKYSWLIPLLPLAGALIAGFFGAKLLRGQSHWPIWLGVGASGIISLSLLGQTIGLWRGGEENLWASKDWYTWIQAGSFTATAGFFFDPLTVVMLCVVTVIGFFITVFAAGYMKGESGYFRFFSYLGLFIFSMTCLVMGNNFIMLYLGWEGVGLCSYLLIGYYYEKPSARDAAKKAFLVNRIGDFGFGIGIMLLFLTFGTVSYFGAGVHSSMPGVLEMATMPLSTLQNIPGVNISWVPTCMKWAPFLLMLGAFGKSAQFPLYVWLPDAMEGPTPVSALIHAATMVTAGVYMIARCGTLFVTNEAAMLTVTCVGAFTALLAATIALRQFDLKKVFAYSTISQLGFMFVGVGCLAPVAGVFHLVTHAFFKALLFLSSGVVMHAMSGVLDMRKMSGVKKVLPITNVFIVVGCLALSGFPLLSGFFSKDEIVAAAFHRSPIIGGIMLVTAFITAYYTFRLYFRVFQGPLVVPEPEPVHAGHDAPGHEDHAHGIAAHETPGHGAPEHSTSGHATSGHGTDSPAHAADDHGHHNHEPLVMMLPLAVLTIGALLAGYLDFPSAKLGEFLGRSPSFIAAYDMASQHYPAGSSLVSAAAFGQVEESGRHESLVSPLMIFSGGVAVAGILIAFFLHLKNRAAGDALPEKFAPFARLLEAKYRVDEIYAKFIVKPLHIFSEILFRFDKWIIDNLVNSVGWVAQLSGYFLKFTTQRGYLQGYAAAMLLGVAAILILIFMH